MALPAHRCYFLDVDEVSHEFSNPAEVERTIRKALVQSHGSLTLSADDGDRPFWHRLLGARIWVRLYFSIEWQGDWAAVIFSDDNASEFRVLASKEQPEVEKSEYDRICFGESASVEQKYLIAKAEGVRCIEHFLKSAVKPDWHSYDFVE